MTDRTNWISPKKLASLNTTIHEKGYVDREDILAFLKMIDTTDGDVIIGEIKNWLRDVSKNPYPLEIIDIPEDDINAIIGDLESYGVIQSLTILKMHETSNRNLL